MPELNSTSKLIEGHCRTATFIGPSGNIDANSSASKALTMTRSSQPHCLWRYRQTWKVFGEKTTRRCVAQ